MKVKTKYYSIKIYSSSGKSYLKYKDRWVIIFVKHKLGRYCTQNHFGYTYGYIIKITNDLIIRYDKNEDSAMSEIREIISILDEAENLYIDTYDFNINDHYYNYVDLDCPMTISYNYDSDLVVAKDSEDRESFTYTKDKEIYHNGDLVDDPKMRDCFDVLIYAIISNGIRCYDGSGSDNYEINYCLRKIFSYRYIFQSFVDKKITEFLHKKEKERLLIKQI